MSKKQLVIISLKHQGDDRLIQEELANAKAKGMFKDYEFLISTDLKVNSLESLVIEKAVELVKEMKEVMGWKYE